MPLKSHIDEATFGSLPDPIKSEYAKGQDGSYVLQVEGVNGYALDNVVSLKDALSGERKLTGELKQKLKGLEDLNVDEAREALAKVKEMKDWKPDDKVAEMIRQKEEALSSKFKGEVEKATGRSKSLQAQLEKALIDGAGAAAIAKHKGNVVALMPHLRGAAKLVENNDGSFSVRFVGQDGNELITKKPNSTEYMGAEEFVEVVLKSDENFMPLFEGVGASGFGSNSGRNSSDRFTSGGELSISEADAKDTKKYRAAKDAATKAGKTLVIRG